MHYTTADLARDCGVTEADAAGFVEALRVWMRKGYTLDQSLILHMNQMRRMAGKAADLARDPEVRAAVVEMIYQPLREVVKA